MSKPRYKTPSYQQTYDALLAAARDQSSELNQPLKGNQMLTEKQIRAESPWMARGYMRQEEVVALRECAKTALPTERLTIKGYLPASSPSRGAAFDGSNAHLLNDAGDAFDTGATSTGS